MAGNSSGADGCEAYVEQNPVQPTKQKDITISVLFSPFPYDMLKDYSYWKSMNYELEFNHYVLNRFVTTLEWDSKIGDVKATQSVSLENVPAYSKISHSINFDKNIFIDCSVENQSTMKYKMEQFEGYLSFAMSEIKDHIFRLHKQGYKGKVKFVLAAYQPMQPLMFAFLEFAGLHISECDVYKDFILCIKQKCWFASFENWLYNYDWTPTLENASVYQGFFYGMSQETPYAKYQREVERYQTKFAEFCKLTKKTVGIYPDEIWGRDDCNKWKDEGYYTTDYDSFGLVTSLYGKGQSPNWPLSAGGGVLLFNWRTEKIEVPVYEYDGKYWTAKRLKDKVHEYFEKSEECRDGAPKWVLYKNKYGSGGIVENRLDQKLMNADDMQKEFDEWEEHTYNPQHAENKEYLERFDSRLNDSTEYEIWKRKSVEDEAISDQWSARIDEIEYHGKMVNRATFQEKEANLNKEYNNRKAAIADQRNIEKMETWLKILSVAQAVVGLVSLGASAPISALIFVGVDAGLELCKMRVQFKYDKNYGISKALEDHVLNFLFDSISAAILIPAFVKLAKAKKVNSLVKKTQTIQSPETYNIDYTGSNSQIASTASRPNSQIASTIGESNSQIASTIGESNSQIASTAKMHTTSHQVYKAEGKEFEIYGMVKDSDKVWVRMKNGDKGTALVQRDKNWIKKYTGKEIDEIQLDLQNQTNSNNSGRLQQLYQESAEITAEESYKQLAKQYYNPGSKGHSYTTYSGQSTINRASDIYTAKPNEIIEIQNENVNAGLKRWIESYNSGYNHFVIEEKGVIHLLKESTFIYTGVSTIGSNFMYVYNKDQISLNWAEKKGIKTIDNQSVKNIFI